MPIRQVLVKHLVCACTGPTSRFGDILQYSNLMAAAAAMSGHR